jgi:hypothetical protein
MKYDCCSELKFFFVKFFHLSDSCNEFPFIACSFINFQSGAETALKEVCWHDNEDCVAHFLFLCFAEHLLSVPSSNVILTFNVAQFTAEYNASC